MPTTHLKKNYDSVILLMTVSSATHYYTKKMLVNHTNKIKPLRTSSSFDEQGFIRSSVARVVKPVSAYGASTKNVTLRNRRCMRKYNWICPRPTINLWKGRLGQVRLAINKHVFRPDFGECWGKVGHLICIMFDSWQAFWGYSATDVR